MFFLFLSGFQICWSVLHITVTKNLVMKGECMCTWTTKRYKLNCIIFLILSSHNYNSSCVFFPYLSLNRITMERRWKNWSLLMSNYLFWLADTTQPHARINFRWSKGEGFLVRLCHGSSRGFKQRRLPRYFKYAKWLWQSMTKEEIRAARTNRKIKLNSKPAKPTWNSREIETK